jgi:hypothetical protein
MSYLTPLVAKMRGNAEAESLTTMVFGDDFDVASLATFVETCVSQRSFPLYVSPDTHGKHVGENYKSAKDNSTKVSEAIAKRVNRGQTAGPFKCSVDDLPLQGFGVNSLGAVPKKGTTSLRPVDDVWANARTSPPHFRMPSIDWLRRTATPHCFWWLVDIEDAFANLPIGPDDKRWLLFRWHDTADVNFEGSPDDCVYVHTHGCFGPRSLPFLCTALQHCVNIAALAAGVPAPVMGHMDDNCSVMPTYASSMASLQLCKTHLRRAGLPDKPSKEKPPFQVGEILGRCFNSLMMTISITTDKVVELTSMLSHCSSPAAMVSFKELESVVGF